MLSVPKARGNRIADLWGQSSAGQPALSAARRTVPHALFAMSDVEGAATPLVMYLLLLSLRY